MNKTMKIYIVLFVFSLVFAYYASSSNKEQGKNIQLFNLGTNEIESVSLESVSKEVKIYKQDAHQSDKSKKVLNKFKNTSALMVSYLDKSPASNKKQTKLEALILRGSYAAHEYLDSYCPLYIDRIIETDNLASFGLTQESDKIIVKTSKLTKTLWVGDLRHDSYYRYYYDTDTKKMFLGADELYTTLVNANSKLISYELSDIKEEDISSLTFEDISKKAEPKTMYKVLTQSKSMGWASSKTTEADPKLSRFVQFIMRIPTTSRAPEGINPEVICEIALIKDDQIIETIKISKYMDEFLGKSNYTTEWVKLDKRSMDFFKDIIADI